MTVPCIKTTRMQTLIYMRGMCDVFVEYKDALFACEALPFLFITELWPIAADFDEGRVREKTSIIYFFDLHDRFRGFFFSDPVSYKFNGFFLLIYCLI